MPNAAMLRFQNGIFVPCVGGRPGGEWVPVQRKQVDRMNKQFVAMALAGGLSLALATSQGIASAAASNSRARCIGQVVSASAGPGFGQTVGELVATGEVGRHTGIEASSNVCD